MKSIIKNSEEVGNFKNRIFNVKTAKISKKKKIE